MADNDDKCEDDQSLALVMRERAYEDGVNSPSENEPINHDDNNDDNAKRHVIC